MAREPKNRTTIIGQIDIALATVTVCLKQDLPYWGSKSTGKVDKQTNRSGYVAE